MSYSWGYLKLAKNYVQTSEVEDLRMMMMTGGKTLIRKSNRFKERYVSRH